MGCRFVIAASEIDLVVRAASASGRDEHFFCNKILQIPGCGGLAGFGDGDVFLCGHAALESAGAFVEHATQHLELAVVQLAANTVEQLCLFEREFDFGSKPMPGSGSTSTATTTTSTGT